MPQSGCTESLRVLIVPCFWSQSLAFSVSWEKQPTEQEVSVVSRLFGEAVSAESTIDSLFWPGKLSSSSQILMVNEEREARGMTGLL